LAGYTGARLHIAHLSTAGSVELVRQARKKGINVTCEVTPHHLTLTEEAVDGYDTNAKVNPPLRTEADIDALIEGIKDGTIDAIATDHAPHSLNEKQQEFGLAAPGISNFETCLGALLGLVDAGKIDMNTLIDKLTCGPAKVLGNRFGRIGALVKGWQADLTIFDPECVWEVETDRFASLGHNTPLAGKKLRGRVIMTLYGGNTVYRDPQYENMANTSKGSRHAG
jgi:dihydroorotase